MDDGERVRQKEGLRPKGVNCFNTGKESSVFRWEKESEAWSDDWHLWMSLRERPHFRSAKSRTPANQNALDYFWTQLQQLSPGIGASKL